MDTITNLKAANDIPEFSVLLCGVGAKGIPLWNNLHISKNTRDMSRSADTIQMSRMIIEVDSYYKNEDIRQC